MAFRHAGGIIFTYINILCINRSESGICTEFQRHFHAIERHLLLFRVMKKPYSFENGF